MKKLFYLLLAAMLIGVSCEDSSKDVDSTTPKGVVFASGTEMTVEFGSEGGSKSFIFTSDLDWEVTTSADWISVTPSSGTPSVKKFTVKASANDSFEERSGTVTMTTTDDHSYTIEVTQAAEEETFTINGKGEYEVSAAGGEVKVRVTTNLEYTVDIPSTTTWLSVADTRAVREDTLTFTVKENESFNNRSATVRLKGADGKVLQSIVFMQKGVEQVFSVSGKSEYEFDENGGEVKVKVTTNIDYEVTIPAEAQSWLSMSRAASNSDELIFAVAKNDGFEERSTTVQFVASNGKEVRISFKQKSLDVILSLDKQEHLFFKDGGSVDVVVTTNIDYDIEIANDASSWLTCYNTRATKQEQLIVSASPMEGETFRSAEIRFKDVEGNIRATFNVSQDSAYRVSYTTNNALPLEVYTKEGFGATYLSNIYDYETGRGALRFDAPITAIPEQAFALCVNLTSIELSEGVTTIGASAFMGCSSMQEITIPSTVVAVGNEAFVGCTGRANINCEITGAYSYDDVADVAFTKSAFSEVVIGDKVTKIGYEAFCDCDALRRVTFGKGLKTLSYGAFYGCAAITNIALPEGVTTIESSAMFGCASLATITIPSSVEKIGSTAFGLCQNLTIVYCKPTTPPASESPLFSKSSLLKIYIPKDKERDYKLASAWNEYIDNFVLYDYATNSVVDSSHTPHPRDKWIGTWHVSASQVMIIDDDVTFEDRDMSFDITIVPHSLYAEEVVIYGLSASNHFARAYVEDDGRLQMVNGVSVGEIDADGFEPMWLMYYEHNGSYGFSIDQRPSYTFTLDSSENSAVAKPASFKNNQGQSVTILSAEVYAVNQNKDDIAFYTKSFPVTYHAGEMKLQRADTRATLASDSPVEQYAVKHDFRVTTTM